MSYDIIFAPDVAKALQKIRAYDRVAILDAIERNLRHEPTRTSKSRIKQLRDLRHPQYRLRIGNMRVFYDVSENRVEVVGVMHKGEVAAWLRHWGITTEEGGLSI